MKHTTIKTVLVFIFILILTVFFIYSPNNYSIEKFSNIQDDLIINEDDYIYTANTKEIFINQTFKNAKLFSNATIEGIAKDYIADDVIVIDNFNNTYFDNKILIGNKSIDIYLDKTRPKQFDFFYYYVGNKPGVVRFFNSDGSMEDKNTKHKAINSFVLTNNADNKIGTDVNYIFAYDLIENRPNVNYKTITFMNTKNGAKPPTTSTNEENEPYKSVKSNDVLSNINEIDCNLSLIGNSDMSSIINGNTACTVKNTNKTTNIPITFSTKQVPSPSVPSPSVPSPSVPSPSVPNPAIMNALASAPNPVYSPNPVTRRSTPDTYSPNVTSSPITYKYSPSPSVPSPSVPSPSVPSPSVPSPSVPSPSVPSPSVPSPSVPSPSVPSPSVPSPSVPSPSVPSPSVPSPSVPNPSPSVPSPTIVTTPPVITGSYNVKTIGANNVITFWGNGTINLPVTTDVNTLIVGGGGAGGSQEIGRGGGGGGGVGTGTISLIGGTKYTITVGKGGIASKPSTSGDNSQIYDDTKSINEIAYGGGAGNGLDGGCGGGGSLGGQGGKATMGSGKLTYYGKNGGFGGMYEAGGGGGGASSAGSNATNWSHNGANGGEGYKWPITNTVYGSGGGGGGFGDPVNKGGVGGTNADNGGTTAITPTTGGIIGTGSGGGGSGTYGGNGSNGGSGAVIFSIPTALYPASLFSPGIITPTPPPPPPPTTLVSKQVAGTGSNVISINNVDIAGLSSDGYNVYAYTTPNNSNASIAVNLSQPQTMNIFLVGGGGNGGYGTGSGGGGGGGVVSQTIVLPAGNYTISVTVGNIGSLGSRDTIISYNNGAVKYIARAGGNSCGFGARANGRPTSGGSGGGAGWSAYTGLPNEPGVQLQSGNVNDQGYKNTVWEPGTGNTADNNIANPGGKGLINLDAAYNNCNVGGGGGGGAGTAGKDATLIQNVGGNDQDGYPIGPIKGGDGGDGILCTLPGIKNFTYNGKNWGQLYWAGGGGAGRTGYTYNHSAPIDYTKPTISGNGGKGGGGGGEGEWYTGQSWPNGTRASGIDDKSGLNPANDKNAYYMNSGGNTGGAGGLNTGGGGGGGGYRGGEGGSGIVIISFTK